MPALPDPALTAAALALALVLGAAAGPVGRRLVGCAGPAPRGAAALAPAGVTLLLALHALAVLPPAQVLPAVGLAGVLVAISVADLETMLIPDALSLPLIPAGLVLAALTAPADLPWSVVLPLHAVAAALGYLLIWGLAALWRRYRGVEGIGMGDAKLLAAAGAWLGPAGLPGVLLYGSVAGLLAILAWSAWRGTSPSAGQAVPFGPFLALGFWLVAIHGPPGL